MTITWLTLVIEDILIWRATEETIIGGDKRGTGHYISLKQVLVFSETFVFIYQNGSRWTGGYTGEGVFGEVIDGA